MKKMKGVVPVMEKTSLYGDQRAIFKHQSLLQDFEELFKETEAKKKRLEMMKQKRSVLLAEVKFLRRRYEFLMQNKSQNTPLVKNHVQPQKVLPAAKYAKKAKHSGADASVQQHKVPRVGLKLKSKVYGERDVAFRSPAPIFDLNKRQKTYMGKEAALRNPITIADLSQKGRISSGKEASVRKITPIFDLNEISREEEELHANGDAMAIEELRFGSLRSSSDEQLNDMKVSACRNAGNGSSRTGKRKISWQDPVAV